MKRWLSLCQNIHKTCRHDHQSLLPTRVIDVGLDEPGEDHRSIKLVDSNGKCDRYAILSYCWGPIPQLKTTLPLLEQHKQEIDLAKLSQTVRDAIVLTRGLGLRYLWIDALCIVQSLPEEDVTADFLHEAPRMRQYYGNAHVAIMVMDAQRCQDGFLNNTLQPDCQALIPLGKNKFDDGNGVVVDDPERSTKQIMAYHRPPDSTSLNTALQGRCWTLQEEYLSPRKLYFYQHRVEYRCESMFYSDLGAETRLARAKIGPRNPPTRLEQIINATSPGSPAPAATAVTTSDPHSGPTLSWSQANGLNVWYTQLKAYSARSITGRSDIFTALTGLSATFAPVIRSRFLWGVWECDFARGLLWSRWLNSSRRGYVAHTNWKPEVLPDMAGKVPSWSWANKQCEKDTVRRRGHGAVSPEMQQGSEDERLFGTATDDAEFINLSQLDDSFDPIREPSVIAINEQNREANRILKVRGRLARLSMTHERCYHALADSLLSFHNNRRLVRLLRDPTVGPMPPWPANASTTAFPNYTPNAKFVLKTQAIGDIGPPSDSETPVSSSTSISAIAQSQTTSSAAFRPAEAIAALDDGSYELYGTEFYCLRITCDLGLLLLPMRKQVEGIDSRNVQAIDDRNDGADEEEETFVRVGLFIVSNREYWDALPKRVVKVA